jgi:hypothetical protein
VKGSFFVGIFEWVTRAIPTLGSITRFSFATRPLSSITLVASFLIRLNVVDKFAVPVGVIALS